MKALPKIRAARVLPPTSAAEIRDGYGNHEKHGLRGSVTAGSPTRAAPGPTRAPAFVDETPEEDVGPLRLVRLLCWGMCLGELQLDGAS